MILTKFANFDETHDLIACIKLIQFRESFKETNNKYPSM